MTVTDYQIPTKRHFTVLFDDVAMPYNNVWETGIAMVALHFTDTQRVFAVGKEAVARQDRLKAVDALGQAVA